MKQRTITAVLLLFTCVFTSCISSVVGQDDADEADFMYTRGEVPDVFSVGQHYPDRSETVSCRPIRLHILRNSRLYRSNLVVNSNPDIDFANEDARLMTPRLQTKLNALAVLFHQRTSLRITVLRAWSEYSEDDEMNDPNSLHYEGRTVQLRVRRRWYSLLLILAVEAGFDWVFYADRDYVRLSVIPDVCDVNLDLVFMLDQSGSVGPDNHYIALDFMREVVSYYNISTNSTQVGLVTFSSGATIEFGLNVHNNLHSLLSALSAIRYTGGWTTTAWALYLTSLILDPSESYGARPATQGVPKVAVLITDGRSNIYPINEVAPFLRESGVQVYTVGIGDIYLPELRFIASDPDNLHVFVLNSFTDAPNFVDFLSFTTCDSPAIVEPGDNTTTEVEEDEFRFFQSECAAFSVTVMIEQIDLVGSCSLYASTQLQNPGPLSSSDLVVRNEDRQVRRRSVHLNFHNQGGHRFVYWSVRGHYVRNTFSVIIWDMIFAEDEYVVYVTEGVSGRVILDLNMELRTTNVTFNYTITEGNEGGLFDIGQQSGLLQVVSPINADQYDYFLLTIVAQNSQYSCHRGRVNVKVIVVRENLVFQDVQPQSIPENSDIGTPVAQVQATGADGSIVYSIIGGNEGGAFEIDETTGEITVASELNFEVQDTYSLTIQAQSGATGNTGSVVQVINILDVNEAPFFTNPCTSFGSCVFNVDENQPVNTPVDTLTADDPDRPNTLNGMLDFSLSPEGMAVFTIQGNGRQADLSTNAVFDRETQDSYSFSVTVSDRGSPSLSADLQVTVVVDDVNDNAPVFIQPPDLLSVLESENVTSVVTQYFVTDNDIGTNAEIVYSISSDDAPVPFEIDPSTGSLVINQTLDFETNTFYILSVTASNPDGLQRATTETVILILDVNDNPPVFSQDVYTGTIVENSAAGTVILTVMANDRDSGINGQVVFSIISGNFQDLIAVESVTNNIGVVQMATTGNIDREEIQMFNLTVRANDLGSPQLEDFARVIVTVLDINDHAPTFLPSSYQGSLREDSSPMDVLDVFVFDLDQPGTPNTDLTFEITDGNIGGVFELNKVDNFTARLRLVGQLDFETLSRYDLQVIATDNGEPQMSGTATIRIDVINVNENPPVVDGNQTIDLPESTQQGAVIAMVNASDIDSARINFTITNVMGMGGVNGGATLGIFAITSNGSVTLERPLDFEANSKYVITIVVTDGQLTATTTLIVNVLDENEFPPDFNEAAFTVLEQEPAGTVVGTVQATDADAGSGSNIMYSIVSDGPISSFFEVDSVMGVITTSEILDRELLVELFSLFLPSRDSTSSLRIRATDSGMPSLSTTAEFRITLVDINDNAPIFEQISNNFSASVMEEKSSGEPVFTGTATDRDLGSNGEVFHSLQVLNLPPGTPVPFVIDPSTGRVTTNQVLDREERSEYQVVVTARDNGDSPLSNTVSGVVTVLDVNDNDPMFSQPQYEQTIPENTEVPFNVVQVSASDSDQGSNSNITYSIQLTNPSSSSSLFTIDAVSGVITLIGQLDFETTPLHTLTVRAQDSGAPPRSTTAQVLVRVGNVDEVPPRFDRPCTVTVRESVSPGTPIMQCTATDIDDVTNSTSGALRYEILEGNIGGAFNIANDGTVTVARPVDRETLDFYSILIQVTDSAELTDTTLLNVTISDVNDNAPEFVNASATVLVSTSDIQSHVINLFTVEATDDDIGSNAELVYTLTQVTRQPNGVDSVLWITVSDRGSEPLSNTTNVLFVFEPSCTLQDYEINSTDGRIFSRFLCSVNVEPLALSVTIGTEFQLMCNILRNTEVEYEWLHNGTVTEGPLVLPPPNPAAELVVPGATFMDAGEYACRVMTSIGSLQSSNAVVMIQVPPTITIPPTEAAVELGRGVQFRCFSTGIPTPTMFWSRPTTEGGSEMIVSDDRVFAQGNFLIIFETIAGDQGVYTCNAVNAAGSASASTMLVIFGLVNVVTVEVAEFSNPNMENTCHELNTTEFESIMTGITSVNTMTTDQSGENLCNQSACSPSPCQNGGTCELQSEDDMNEYVCTCSVGYTGVNCESDIDECAEDPCLFGGTCTNTNGSFTCACQSQYTGHRCQYSTVCETQNPCPQNQSCVATVANTLGYVCVEVNASDSVVVTGSGDMTTGALDDQVNSIQETQSTTTTQQGRRRRQTVTDNNGFVTACEPRFITSPKDEAVFVLVWACPDGLQPPSGAELDEICRLLFETRLVTSCSSPTGVSYRQPLSAPLPSTTITISFILVDENGAPLSGAETLEILQETNALGQLRERGFEATNFTAAVPPPQEAEQSAPTEVIVGILVAILLAAALAGLLFLIVCLVKYKRSRIKKPQLDPHHPTPNVYQLESSDPAISRENTFENHYTCMHTPGPEESEHTFVFPTPAVTVHKPIETSPSRDSPEEPAQTAMFDDNIYATGYVQPSQSGQPTRHIKPRSPASTPFRKSSKKRKSLERAASLIKKRTNPRSDSVDNLLKYGNDTSSSDDDYEHLTTTPDRPATSARSTPQRQAHHPPTPPTAQYDDDEVIYGNLEHTKEGARGNAGQRWESYWKTSTLLVSPQHNDKEKQKKH